MSNESLEIVTEDIRRAILEAVFSSGDPASIAETARNLGLDTLGLVELVNEPSFMARIRKVSFTRASIALHGAGLPDLIAIGSKGKDRDRVTAWRTIAQITGDLKHKHQHDVRITFEDLRKREGEGDLSGLFDIRSTVIEAEIEDGSE